MRCKKLKKFLFLFPEELTPDKRKLVNEHIKECKKCRSTLNYLRQYGEYTKSEAESMLPEGFNEKVFRRVRILNESRGIKKSSGALIPAIGIAASALIFFLLIKPFSTPTGEFITVSFTPKSEKRGKGPVEKMDFSAIDFKITDLLKQSNGIIKEQRFNPVTGYYDFITVGIPHDNLDQFQLAFNEVSETPIVLPEGMESSDGNIYLQLSFDVINFSAGNFDGDGKDDIIIQFLSGKNKGKWIICRNDDLSFYTAFSWIEIENQEKYLADYEIITGDFNGDGYDDLFLYLFAKNKGLITHLLINGQNMDFREVKKNSYIFPSDIGERFRCLITGDSDDDGKDELIWVTIDSSRTHYFYVLDKGYCLCPLKYPGAGDSFDYLLTGDFNSDGYFDICFKYISGTRAADTDILLNSKSGYFDAPASAGRSFEGDYIILSGDYNGDGFTDLIIKSGGNFISGTWYILPNDAAGVFGKTKQFKLILED